MTGTCEACGAATRRKSANSPGALPAFCDQCRTARRYERSREINRARKASDPAYAESERVRVREANRERRRDPAVREQLREKGRAHKRLVAADPVRGPIYRDQMRRTRLRRVYGLTPEDYARLLAEQDGGCAICGSVADEQRLAVDHDHQTGQVRGILCAGCNNGLGRFRDDPALLRAAADYLSG